MARLWANVDGEPFMVNPSLAVWNSPRRRRRRRNPRDTERGVTPMAVNRPRKRRRVRARRRYARNIMTVPVNPRRRRRNQPPYFALNRRRRRRSRSYRRNPIHNPDGMMNLWTLMPIVGAGVGAGLAIGYLTPWVSQTMGLPAYGGMYRMLQGVVAFGSGWALRMSRVVAPRTANAYIGTGLAIVALGLIQDWQSGMLMQPAPAPVPATQGVGYYRQAFGRNGAPALSAAGSMGYEAYGTSPSMLSGTGYYEAR